MAHLTVNEDNSAGFTYWLKFWCRVIAASQIIGGLFGIYLLAFRSTIGTAPVIFLFAFSLFAVSVWSGVLLVRGKPIGLTASLVVQSLQLVQVNVPSFLYSFCCGLQLILGIGGNGDHSQIGFNFYLPARFFLFINPPQGYMTQHAFTGLNLVALLSLVCLYYVRITEKKHPQIADSYAPNASEQDNIWPPTPKL